MPQLTHHNFYSNFTASIKAGDLDMTNDILANELSDFIVFDTDKIIQALNKSEITISKSNTDEEIVDAVIKNISTNKKLIKALAFIIAEGNELLVSEKDKQKQLKIVANISDGLNKIAKDISKTTVAFKESAMDQVVSKAAKRTEYNRVIWNKDKKGMSSGMVFLIGGGVLALAIVIIYYRQKHSVTNAIPNMIMGGDVNTVVNPPAIPVVAPVVHAAPVQLLPEPVITPAPVV